MAAEELGRGTGRARTTLDAIARLSNAASAYQQQSGGAYSQFDFDSTRFEPKRGLDSGTFKVGSMKTFSAGPVVPLVASRIKCVGRPSFDPRPLLTSKSKALYEDPAKVRLQPTVDVPVARVLASRTEFIKLLELMDP